VSSARPVSAALLALAALLARAPGARAYDLDQEVQLWGVFSTTFIRSVDGVRLIPYLEVQPRLHENSTRVSEVQHRVAFFVEPWDHLRLGAGFLYSARFTPQYTPEYRPYQEVSLKDSWGGVRVHARLRLEERFIEGSGKVSMRLRARVGAAVPLGRVAGKELSFVAWEEAFVNLNDTPGRPQGFDQNRAFVGLGLRVAAGIQVQLGYMAQYGNHPGSADTLGHTLYLDVALTFE
jgi:hypothetical protein